MWETRLIVCLKKSRAETWCCVLRKKLYRNAPLSPGEYRRVPMRDIREAPNTRGGGGRGERNGSCNRLALQPGDVGILLVTLRIQHKL